MVLINLQTCYGSSKNKNTKCKKMSDGNNFT